MGQYKSHSEHSQTLATILGDMESELQIRHRNNAATGLPTDFLVVALKDSTATATLHRLREHPGVKYVVQDQRLKLSLKGTGLELELDDDDGQYDAYAAAGNFDAPRRFRAQGAFIEEEIPEMTTEHGRRLSAKASITDTFEADTLWKEGFTGQGVRVAVFDTGLDGNHKHFRNIEERTNWTSEKKLEDGLGHGSFVAGVIAGQFAECKGFAPDALVHVFRVFTTRQLSYTSWFLDAFNYAIHSQVDVLNLSIGGPDFLDFPFVDKVREMSANNIIVVSAIGNDGPLYGTLNNPADQMDVIGVGGVNGANTMAGFSSRGMTTWELPEGYGRVKPDIVSFSQNLRGSSASGGCRSLSGTSVASPVIAGAVTLLASVVPFEHRNTLVNPASMKQVLVESATILPVPNIFEQGHGLLNLVDAFKLMRDYKPRASVIPSNVDLTLQPYFWPYSSQGMYVSAMPVILNLTILNGLGVSGALRETPIWEPKDAESDILDVVFEYPQLIWPWTGYLAVFIRVRAGNENVERIVEGKIKLTVLSDLGASCYTEVSFKGSVIPVPDRSLRVLWDQFHNLRYPSGYFPRDNLASTADILDWNGDHPHTNFRNFFDEAVAQGFFVEILGRDFTCFAASNYGTLIIVDSEEEFFPEEVEKLRRDVLEEGLSVVIMAEWYNLQQMKQVRFLDENTQTYWDAITGGGNIPALNDLLAPFSITLGDQIFDGNVKTPKYKYDYGSGTSIIRFPKGGYLSRAKLKLRSTQKTHETVILGAVSADVLRSTNSSVHGTGDNWVVVFGDTSCLDMNHRLPGNMNCKNLVMDMLSLAGLGNFQEGMFEAVESQAYVSTLAQAPEREHEKLFATYSKVKSPGARPQCIGLN